MIGNLFKKNDNVTHYVTGKVYKIALAPHNFRRLEDKNETFYAYSSVNRTMNTTDKSVTWYRCKREMEDGRFILYKDTHKQPKSS